jgi:hypothetical protein
MINRITYETNLFYIKDALIDADESHFSYDQIIMEYIDRNFDLQVHLEPEQYFDFLTHVLGFSDYFLFFIMQIILIFIFIIQFMKFVKI